MLIDRIKEVVKMKNLNAKKFSEAIDFNYTTLNNYFTGARKTIDATLLEKTASTFEDIDYLWLLTGRGSMLREEAKTPDTSLAVPEVQILHHPKSIEKTIHNQAIKLYDVAAAANLKTLFANKDQNILGEISIPDIPKCDGAIYVRGDSMYPILKSGDIIAYKEIGNFENVIFGEMYLVSFDIEGDDYLTVKYVNRSDQKGYIKLVSYNQHHDPKDIPVSSINAMGLVKFSIRKNTII